MRWYIVRILLYKEWLRHRADRGGFFLAALLIVATLLLSLFRKTDARSAGFVAGVKICYVVWFDRSEEYRHWINYLILHPLEEPKVRFVAAGSMPKDENGEIFYEQSTAAVEVRPMRQPGGQRPRYQVVFRYPGKDPSVLAPFARWFWAETFRRFQDRPLEIDTAEDETVFPQGTASIQVRPSGTNEDGRTRHKLLFLRPGQNGARSAMENHSDSWDRPSLPNLMEIEEHRLAIPRSADERSMVATALVMFALCFFCVYLLPALTCEERERGILLAQALSPASPQEILAAKFLFYPAIGIGLAALLAGIYNPVVLARPFFWMVLLTTSLGYLGVGMTIASLAHSQRIASMGALSYMLTVGLLLYITEQFGIPSVRWIALEYYCPRLLHEIMVGSASPAWWYLVPAVILALIWSYVASVVFRTRGWQ
jgi:hypothetical protein